MTEGISNSEWMELSATVTHGGPEGAVQQREIRAYAKRLLCENWRGGCQGV